MSNSGFAQRQSSTVTSDLIQGLAQIPTHWALTPVSENKAPYRGNWQNEEPVSREIIVQNIKASVAKGYGIRTGRISGGIIAVDADGDAAHQKILELSGGEKLPATIAFTSGKSGRCQYLFQVHPQYWDAIKTTKLKTGAFDSKGKEQLLELRWDGCQSVLPPSVHPETGIYQWVTSPQQIQIAEAPMWVIEQMLRDVTTSNNKPEPSPVLVSPSVPSLSIFLTKDDRALIESGANNGTRNDAACKLAINLVATARRLDELGIRYEGDARYLYEQFCSRCTPPLGSDVKSEDTKWWSGAESKVASFVPALDDQALKNCEAAWQHKQNRCSSETATRNSPKNKTVAQQQPQEQNVRVRLQPMSDKEMSVAIDALIAQNLSGSALEVAISGLAVRAGYRNSQDVRSMYRLRLEEVETLCERAEVFANVEQLLSLSSLSTFDFNDYLHSSLAKPLKMLSKWLGVNEAVLGTILFPACASLLKTQTRMVVLKNSGFVEPPIIYGGIVSESGNGKSPAMKAILAPLHYLQKEEDDRYQLALQQYEAEMVSYKLKSKGKKDSQDEPPARPVPPREYYVQDITYEAFTRVKANQPDNGVLFEWDELSGLFGSFNGYRNGRGSDKEKFLSWWNGSGGKMNRCGKDGIPLRISTHADSTSIIGAIQPNVLKQLMGDINDEQGTWGRFVWALMPTVPHFLPESDITVDVNDLLLTIYRRLSALSATHYSFDKQAQSLFRDWYNQTELRKVAEPRQGLRAAIAKEEGYCARFAMLLHVLWHVAQDQVPPEKVGVDMVKAAIKLVGFYHNQVLLNFKQADADNGEMCAVLTKILETAKKLGKLTVRDAIRNIFSKRGTKDTVLNYFKELVQMGFGKILKKGNSTAFVPELSDCPQPSDSNEDSSLEVETVVYSGLPANNNPLSALSASSPNETPTNELFEELKNEFKCPDIKTADSADTNRQTLITISDLVDITAADSVDDSNDNQDAGNVLKPLNCNDLTSTDSHKVKNVDTEDSADSRPKLKDKEYPPIDAVVARLKEMIVQNEYRPSVSIENYVCATVQNCDRSRLEELLTPSEWEVVEASVWV